MTTKRGPQFSDTFKPGPSQMQRAVLDSFAATVGRPTAETAAKLAALEFTSPATDRALSEMWSTATQKLSSPFWAS